MMANGVLPEPDTDGVVAGTGEGAVAGAGGEGLDLAISCFLIREKTLGFFFL